MIGLIIAAVVVAAIAGVVIWFWRSHKQKTKDIIKDVKKGDVTDIVKQANNLINTGKVPVPNVAPPVAKS